MQEGEAADHVVHEEVHASARGLPGTIQTREAVGHCVHALQQGTLEVEAVQVCCHWLLTQVYEFLQQRLSLDSMHSRQLVLLMWFQNAPHASQCLQHKTWAVVVYIWYVSYMYSGLVYIFIYICICIVSHEFPAHIYLPTWVLYN